MPVLRRLGYRDSLVPQCCRRVLFSLVMALRLRRSEWHCAGRSKLCRAFQLHCLRLSNAVHAAETRKDSREGHVGSSRDTCRHVPYPKVFVLKRGIVCLWAWVEAPQLRADAQAEANQFRVQLANMQQDGSL